MSTFSKTKELFLKNTATVVWLLGKHAFLAILILFLVSIACGGFLIFKHVSSLRRESETVNTPVKFREDLYRAVLEARKIREDFSKNPPTKEYSDPFQ